MKENRNRAVLYLRLSKEDVNKLNAGDDSASIKNQRLLLMDYAIEHMFDIVKVYSDDDESGLYDDRPAFESMIKDAQAGLFDIIIAKTQSRFSRNMEHIEKYLHHDLPNMGIRFIGVVDKTDTADRENKKSRQINGLVNEWYCEDLSSNIRSSLKAKMKDGQFLGASCPYGYKKDPDNHSHLVIDPYAAMVVKKIFQLYLAGNGKAKIASVLSSEGILIPTRYKQEVLGVNYQNNRVMDTTNWSYQTIHSIINNQTYTGCLVQNKTNTLSYKDKKKKRLPESEWIIAEHTHEPIIDCQTFEKAQKLQRTKTRTVTAGRPKGLFSGLIFCADCRHAMSRQYKRHGSHEFQGYLCKTYKTQGKKFCESHSIRHEELESAVLSSLKKEAEKLLTEEDVRELKKFAACSDQQQNLELQLECIRSQIKKQDLYKKKTYHNFLENLLTRQEYRQYRAEYDETLTALNRQKKIIEEQLNRQKESGNQRDQWTEAFADYINIEKLDRELVVELVDRIEVNGDGSINLYVRF